MIITSKKFIRWEDELPVSLVELRASEASELPEADEDGIVQADGTVLAEGSIAWVISTGTLYGLTADGEWVDQKNPTSGGGE